MSYELCNYVLQFLVIATYRLCNHVLQLLVVMSYSFDNNVLRLCNLVLQVMQIELLHINNAWT
jgi:hypothetical protein